MLNRALSTALLLAVLGLVSSRRRHKMAASSTHEQTRGGAIDKAFGEVVTFTPTGDHLGTVIFMHGLGDSCDGWTDVVESVFAPALPHIKFIVPTSSTLPVTINGGMRMPAWYDIESLGVERSSQECAGIVDSREYVRKLIAGEESNGIPRSRVALAGFSQGGAMALFTGLQSSARLAGVAVLSGYLPAADVAVEGFGGERTKKIPIHFFHGDSDPVVRYAWGEQSRDAVKALGVVDVAFSTYKGLVHSAHPQELQDVLTFLTKVLPDPTPVEDAGAAAVSAEGEVEQ